MVITRVTSTTVYHTYANANTGKCAYKTDRAQFERDYPTTEEA